MAECSLRRIERTRDHPLDRLPKRRYVCSCGSVGRWTISAAAALGFWRSHAGVSPSVTRRDALRG